MVLETFDPDVAFSYLDDKIERILGHFRKDFEGVISAEKLGPMFGDYGSFLPMYPRQQPSLSCLTTATRVCSSSRTSASVFGMPSSHSAKIPSKTSCLSSALVERSSSHDASRNSCSSSACSIRHQPELQTNVSFKTASNDSFKIPIEFAASDNAMPRKSLKIRIKLNGASRTYIGYRNLVHASPLPSPSLGNRPAETGVPPVSNSITGAKKCPAQKDQISENQPLNVNLKPRLISPSPSTRSREIGISQTLKKSSRVDGRKSKGKRTVKENILHKIRSGRLSGRRCQRPISFAARGSILYT